ncbi:MAG: hypothetical protein U0354_08760 [Candidatus Sericytochromatia bacterium]
MKISSNFIKKNNIRFLVIILLILIPSCSKKDIESKEVNTVEEVAPSMLPVESPDSYEKDIEDYEPTDSISQDSDGAVH